MAIKVNVSENYPIDLFYPICKPCLQHDLTTISQINEEVLVVPASCKRGHILGVREPG